MHWLLTGEPPMRRGHTSAAIKLHVISRIVSGEIPADQLEAAIEMREALAIPSPVSEEIAKLAVEAWDAHHPLNRSEDSESGTG